MTNYYFLPDKRKYKSVEEFVKATDGVKKEKNTCMRCGADKKETRRLKDKCSTWGKYYGNHLWGIFTGKTYKIKE